MERLTSLLPTLAWICVTQTRMGVLKLMTQTQDAKRRKGPKQDWDSTLMYLINTSVLREIHRK